MTEHRLPVVIAAVIALATYFVLPREVQFMPSWVIPAIGGLVLVPLILFNPRRMNQQTKWSRWISIAFALGLAAVNQVYVVRLIIELVGGVASGPIVLLVALSVWITSVIAFAIVYWELDCGGPVARRVEGINDAARQDFLFPQQDRSPQSLQWNSSFIDYAYFSLSNMMAFSPTDAMPISTLAKALMGYQAFTGFVLLALVISRAVNILT